MKLKKFKKSIIMFLLILIVISFITTMSFATDDPFSTKQFENSSKVPEKLTNLTENSSQTIISVVRIIAVTIAVTMLLVISMKYMLSSAGDRADIKKHAVAYVIGAFILFGVTGILGILVDLSKTLSAT